MVAVFLCLKNKQTWTGQNSGQAFGMYASDKATDSYIMSKENGEKRMMTLSW